MAASLSLRTLAILSLALALSVQGTLGGIVCEDLNKDKCAFTVSYSGKRCVLEKKVRMRTGEEAYTCRTSEIAADMTKDWIESDQCIEACGLDRKSLGISSDSLLESSFTKKLCSPQCYNSCPNIVDLYFNLAAGEGIFLPKLCESKGENARRTLSEMKSSGFVAPGPISTLSESSKFVAMGPISEEKFTKYIVAPEMAPLAPSKYIVPPETAPLAPYKYIVAPAMAPLAPSKYIVAPAMAPLAPSKYIVAPAMAPY